MFLPDTNIFISASKNNVKETNFLRQIISQNEIKISVVVIGEYYAKADYDAKQKFDRLLTQFEILNIDERIAKIAGEYRKQMLRTNRTQILDCFLAAQAKIHNLTLVTNNKSDFPMKDIKIISP